MLAPSHLSGKHSDEREPWRAACGRSATWGAVDNTGLIADSRARNMAAATNRKEPKASEIAGAGRRQARTGSSWWFALENGERARRHRSKGSMDDRHGLSGDSNSGSGRPIVNTHVHLPPNFSAFDTPEAAIQAAAAEASRRSAHPTTTTSVSTAVSPRRGRGRGWCRSSAWKSSRSLTTCRKRHARQRPDQSQRMYLCGKALTAPRPDPARCRAPSGGNAGGQRRANARDDYAGRCDLRPSRSGRWRGR